MKRATLLSLFVILLNAAVLHSQTNAYAYGYFTGPDGSLALVNLVRTQDPSTKQITTQLFYTFCGQAGLGTSCQRGDGTIPNSAVVGTVLYDRTKPDTMRVTVDTSAVLGYRNELCTQGIDYEANCLGAEPATGGLVSVTWTRTNEWANIFASTLNQYKFGRLTSAGNSKLGVFSARQTGTVLGVSAAASGAVMTTSTDSQTLQSSFAARKTASIKRQQ